MFPEEFKIVTIKQVTEHAHPVAEVVRRLGVSTNSMYHWLMSYAVITSIIGKGNQPDFNGDENSIE